MSRNFIILPSMKLTIAELAEILKGKVVGEENTPLFKLSKIEDAQKGDITFMSNPKYLPWLYKTKASVVIIDNNLEYDEKKIRNIILVDNAYLSFSEILNRFAKNKLKNTGIHKNSSIDSTVKLGKNVSVGQFSYVGPNCNIGDNVIIMDNVSLQENVIIGNNCKIGSNTIIRNSVVKDNVSILDNCVIGKKGFGFFPNESKNIRYPHIGIVIINDNCEIGCGSTIDRGSLSNTIIGKNTYLDNQVHIAHNNKIGDNCIIAGQVGFAGSSTLGNNVMIGGQAGVSGHLKVGNNVQIGGGSGVIKDIADNTKVMGYPAKNLREFIKDNR